MTTLFYIIEFALFFGAIGIIIYCLKEKKGMNKILEKLSMGKVAWSLTFAIILIYAFSWIATCGIIKLVTLLFGWNFSWAIATGIWLLMCLIKPIFKK